MFEKHWLIWLGIVLASIFNILILTFFIGQSLAGYPPVRLTPVEAIEMLAVILGFCGGILAWFNNRLGALILISGGLLFLAVESIADGALAIGLPFNLFIVAGIIILFGLGLQPRELQNTGNKP